MSNFDPMSKNLRNSINALNRKKTKMKIKKSGDHTLNINY